MSNIKAIALESAKVKVSNETNETKVYNITATVSVSMNGHVDNIESGEVTKDGSSMATFNAWGEDGLTVNYNNVPADDRCAVMDAVSEFITDCRTSTGSMFPVSLTAIME